MKRYIQHEDLKISHFTTLQWEHPVHNHNHFEIIFIHKGKGRHCLSGNHYDFSGECLFLLAPCDTHHFELEEETEFTFLKFTNAYIDLSPLFLQDHRRLIPLLQGASAAEGANPEGASPEAGRTDRLVRLITEEWTAAGHRSNETIFFLIRALLTLIQRNIEGSDVPAGAQQDEKTTAIINYLHSQIHTPEHTQVEHLAEKFGYSRHYLGIFFKEHTGLSLREYVNRHRLHLIEQRLQFSSRSLKEISHEMGFTDQSHFNKFFKTHKGISPSAFREEHTHTPANGTEN